MASYEQLSIKDMYHLAEDVLLNPVIVTDCADFCKTCHHSTWNEDTKATQFNIFRQIDHSEDCILKELFDKLDLASITGGAENGN